MGSFNFANHKELLHRILLNRFAFTAIFYNKILPQAESWGYQWESWEGQRGNRTRGHIFFVEDNHVEGRMILREHDLALKRI